MSQLSKDRHQLYVEGQDDKHTIRHLLIRHGFDHQEVQGFGEDMGDKQAVLSAIPIAVGAGTGKSLGFVMDANDSPQDTWRAVTARLRKVGVQAPKEIPGEASLGNRRTTELGWECGSCQTIGRPGPWRTFCGI